LFLPKAQARRGLLEEVLPRGSQGEEALVELLLEMGITKADAKDGGFETTSPNPLGGILSMRYLKISKIAGFR